jgi:hypothetical protein
VIPEPGGESRGVVKDSMHRIETEEPRSGYDCMPMEVDQYRLIPG